MEEEESVNDDEGDRQEDDEENKDKSPKKKKIMKKVVKIIKKKVKKPKLNGNDTSKSSSGDKSFVSNSQLVFMKYDLLTYYYLSLCRLEKVKTIYWILEENHL